MSLTSTLGIAVSGLTTSQAQIDLVSQNVSNADSVGYIRRTLQPVQQSTGGVTSGVVTRVYDQLLQKQLRTENAGGAYASVRSQYAQQIEQLFGQPGSSSALDSLFNTFTQSVQALADDPTSTTTRAQVIQNAQTLSSSINGISNDIQSLRTSAEQQIASDVDSANAALKGLEDVSRRIAGGDDSATLLDQRDQYIDQLSKLVDIKVNALPNGRVTVNTNSGVTLFDGTSALQFKFDARSALSAGATYSTDPTKRGVGQLTLVNNSGGSIDVVAQGVLRSGEIKGLLDLRDQVLPDAQKQVDELAAGLSRALSDTSPTATTATVGTQSGFDIDIAGIQSGNKVTINFTQQPGNVARSVSIIGVDDPSALPLPYGASGNPNDTVIGVSFAGGVGAALATIQSALSSAGTNLTVANPSGSVLRVLGDAGSATASVKNVTANITQTSLTSGNAALPFFVDSATGAAYTGTFDGGSERTGFAGRITINPALLADTSKLVTYSTSPATPQGDATRPNQIYDALTNATRDFAADSGLSGTTAPFSGTVGDFLRGVVSSQATKSTQAQNLDSGQQVVVNSLQQKFAASAGVSVDQELADLIKLQNAYSANARIISVVQSLFDVLNRL